MPGPYGAGGLAQVTPQARESDVASLLDYLLVEGLRSTFIWSITKLWKHSTKETL